MALDLAFDDCRVQTTNVGISSSTVFQYRVDNFCIQVKLKTTFQPRRDRRNYMFLTREGGRPRSLIEAEAKELKLGKGSKVVRTGDRLGGGVGG